MPSRAPTRTGSQVNSGCLTSSGTYGLCSMTSPLPDDSGGPFGATAVTWDGPGTEAGDSVIPDGSAIAASPGAGERLRECGFRVDSRFVGGFSSPPREFAKNASFCYHAG